MLLNLKPPLACPAGVLLFLRVKSRSFLIKRRNRFTHQVEIKMILNELSLFLFKDQNIEKIDRSYPDCPFSFLARSL